MPRLYIGMTIMWIGGFIMGAGIGTIIAAVIWHAK